LLLPMKDASALPTLVASLLGLVANPAPSTVLASTRHCGAPVAAQQASLRYTSSLADQQAAVREYARQQPGNTPALVDKFVATFGPGAPADYRTLYPKLLAGSGLREDDVAAAFAAYTVATYRVAHNEEAAGGLLPAGPAAAVRTQYAPLVTRLLAGQPAGTTARLGELLKLQAVLVYVGAQRPTAAFRQNVARTLLTRYKLDVQAFTLTDKGLVSKTGAAPAIAPRAAPAPAAAPAVANGSGGVAGAQWFFRSISGAYGGITFEPVALLASGQYCEVGEAPLEGLNLAADRAQRPTAWGTWRKNGSAFVLTDSKGRPSSYSLGTGSWFPAYAAGAVPLKRTYQNASGGSIGGATSLVISKLNFIDGSHFTEGANGGVVTANAAGGSRRSASGTYRLQGHTLTLTYTDGRTVRKSFAIGAKGTPARPASDLLFIGGDAYTDE
jgi:hypothetical protein